MKKRIISFFLFFLSLFMLIRIFFLEVAFFSFSKNFLLNESSLIVLLLEDKKRTVENILETNKYIYSIKRKPILNDYFLKKDVEFNFLNNKIKVIYPFYKKREVYYIIFDGSIFFRKFYVAILQIFLINVILLILMVIVLNWVLKPYLQLIDNLTLSLEKISRGQFDNIEIKYNNHYNLKELMNFLQTYNSFVRKIKDSLKVIESKYRILIDKDIREDPITGMKIILENLVNIFEFKKLAENDKNVYEILERLICIFNDTFLIENYFLFGIDNNEQKIIFYYQKYENKKICCSILNDIKNCRAYRTKNKILSFNKKVNVCLKHTNKNVCYICLPFSIDGNFTGLLKIIIENEKEKEYIEKILPFIEAYLREVSPVVEAKYTLELLHNKTIKDPLTGLGNRNFLEEILSGLINLANRERKKIGFLMIDLDHFKYVNDMHGHKAGDMVLKQLANLFKESVRKSDFIFRYGGEEFLILITGLKNKEELIEVAEKIRKKIENHLFVIYDNNDKVVKLNKTLSIGCSLYNENCFNGWDCIKKADIALYKAKNEGRNKIIFFSEFEENKKNDIILLENKNKENKENKER